MHRHLPTAHPKTAVTSLSGCVPLYYPRAPFCCTGKTQCVSRSLVPTPARLPPQRAGARLRMGSTTPRSSRSRKRVWRRSRRGGCWSRARGMWLSWDTSRTNSRRCTAQVWSATLPTRYMLPTSPSQGAQPLLSKRALHLRRCHTYTHGHTYAHAPMPAYTCMYAAHCSRTYFAPLLNVSRIYQPCRDIVCLAPLRSVQFSSASFYLGSAFLGASIQLGMLFWL